jgi:formylmethanofuran dehydrogenase subunit B
VLVWVAADLDDPDAEPTIDAMSALVVALNERTRFAVLPLGGNDGDVTVNQVCLWQTGFPLRTSFAGGTVDYDPHRFETHALLAAGDVDALLWISSFDAQRTPPATRLPTIVLARPGMPALTPPATVHIDVATPGLHHAGHFFRSDSVVALRLRKLVDAPLPAVADLLRRIDAEL